MEQYPQQYQALSAEFGTASMIEPTVSQGTKFLLDTLSKTDEEKTRPN
jgi:hypothetical protein